MTPKAITLAAQFSIGCAMAIFTAKACDAQWVNVRQGGGVHVRAPFVRVDVYPEGGVSVRAPFTRVDTPGRRPYHVESRPYFKPRGAAAELNAPGELAVMDDEMLRQTLQLNAAHLHQSLGRFNTGASWQRYLRLPEESVAKSLMESDTQDALTRTLDRFRYVATNAQYSMIARLPSFNATQEVLTEMVSRFDDSAAPRNSPEELPLPRPRRNYP